MGVFLTKIYKKTLYTKIQRLLKILFNIQFFFNLLKNLSVLIDILEKILLKFKKYIYSNLTKLFILYTLFLL